MLEAALAEAPHAEAAQVTRALKQMGLPREMHGTPARALSGGERARFCLAQVRVRARVRVRVSARTWRVAMTGLTS